jgi:hypothetical protein
MPPPHFPVVLPRMDAPGMAVSMAVMALATAVAVAKLGASRSKMARCSPEERQQRVVASGLVQRVSVRAVRAGQVGAVDGHGEGVDHGRCLPGMGTTR